MTETDATLHMRYGAGIMVVNAAGEVLLQLRDDPIPQHYGRWTIPGGGREPQDRGSAAATACREVREETGLWVDPATLTLIATGRWQSLRYPGATTEYTFFAAPTTATQKNVVCNEGADMRFQRPARIRELPLVERVRPHLLDFLESALYEELVEKAQL